MRGLKEYLKNLGNEVSGSDIKTGGHSPENIGSDIDVVVRTSAVNPGSPGWIEVEQAQKKGIKVIKRSELLGEITQDKKLIAVSGMHGKTTITAMVGLTMVKAGLDPIILVGEEVKDLGGVLKIGKSDWFVAEVCEYDKSFLDVNPYILILTNIEEEHLDTFPGGIEEIKDNFVQYLGRVAKDGLIIACADDENVKEVISESDTETKVVYYGFKSDKYNKLKFELSIPGEHNRNNALAVTALSDYLNIDQEVTKEVLSNFKGARRRFEYRGRYNGADMIDDYGHHPTEIKKTIEALNEKYPDKKKIVVFWPHQYKRILPLLTQFGEAFGSADEVIIKPIYFVPGRDKKLDVSSESLAEKVNQNKGKAKVMQTDREIADYLKSKLNTNTVLLTIGIPPIYKVIDLLINE
mgnify:CR=1 FL=1